MCVCVFVRVNAPTYTNMVSIYIKSQILRLGCLLFLRLLCEIKVIWSLLDLQHNTRTCH
jgi:hypothetical protein